MPMETDDDKSSFSVVHREHCGDGEAEMANGAHAVPDTDALAGDSARRRGLRRVALLCGLAVLLLPLAYLVFHLSHYNQEHTDDAEQGNVHAKKDVPSRPHHRHRRPPLKHRPNTVLNNQPNALTQPMSTRSQTIEPTSLLGRRLNITGESLLLFLLTAVLLAAVAYVSYHKLFAPSHADLALPPIPPERQHLLAWLPVLVKALLLLSFLSVVSYIMSMRRTMGRDVLNSNITRLVSTLVYLLLFYMAFAYIIVAYFHTGALAYHPHLRVYRQTSGMAAVYAFLNYLKRVTHVLIYGVEVVCVVGGVAGSALGAIGSLRNNTQSWVWGWGTAVFSLLALMTFASFVQSIPLIDVIL